MRRYDFACEPCGVSYVVSVRGGEGTPQAPPCPQCGKPGKQAFIHPPQALVRNKPIKITQKGALPVLPGSDPHGRSAAQIESAHSKFITQKRKYAKRVRREAGLSRKPTFRHLGAVSMHELVAHQRETGDKRIMDRDPIGFLKRTGNYFGDD